MPTWKPAAARGSVFVLALAVSASGCGEAPREGDGAAAAAATVIAGGSDGPHLGGQGFTPAGPDGRSGAPSAPALPQDTAPARPPGWAPVPEPSPEALRYHRIGMWLWGGGIVLSIAIPAAILFSGLSGRLWRWAQARAGPWLLAAGLFTVLYFSFDWLLTLPLDYYRGFVHPKAYGLSNQTVAAWLADSVKELGFLLLLVTVAVPGTYAFLRRAPKRWWLWASGFAAVAITFITLIHPVFVAPAFDDFGPMRDRALEAEILALAERAGVEAASVYEVDKSEDTETVNAYVTGILGTHRIVLWDTALEKLEREQILFVMSHEIGHYVLRHTWSFIAFTTLAVLLSLYAAHRLLGGVVERFRERIGFSRVEEVASLPLLLLVFVVIGLVLQPVQMAFSRHQEHEADRFALEMTQDNRAGATSFVTLQRTNLGVPDPGPVYRIFRASHPVLADRIVFSNTYRPWETGEAMRYAEYFEETR